MDAVFRRSPPGTRQREPHTGRTLSRIDPIRASEDLGRRSIHGPRHAAPPTLPHGRACMLRAPFKSRPARRNSPVTPSTHPAPDLIRDGDTPSLPSSTREGLHAASPIQVTPGAQELTRHFLHAPNPGLDQGRRHAIPPILSHGRARMLRAPFKSRPSRGNSPVTSSTRPTPDKITDGVTPSLPSFRTGLRRPSARAALRPRVVTAKAEVRD